MTPIPYTPITTGDIDPDSPITTTLMAALRDNPAAMFQGAEGAPRLYGHALANLEAGDYVHYQVSGEYTAPTSSSTYTAISAFTFTIRRSGVVRLRWDAVAPGDYDHGFYTRIYKNGAAVGVVHQHTNDRYTDAPTIVEDIAVNAGDVIGVWARRLKYSYSYNKVKNLRVSCSDRPFVIVV